MRFAKRAISPTVDPIQNYTELTPTLTPLGPGHGARRVESGMGPRQRAAEGRGAARRDDRDLHRDQDLPDRHHVVEPAAARLRRHHRAARARARPTASGSPTRPATASPGRPRPSTIPAGTPTASTYSDERASRQPELAVAPRRDERHHGLRPVGLERPDAEQREHPQHRRARCSTRATPRRTSPAPRARRTVQGVDAVLAVRARRPSRSRRGSRRRRPPAARSSASATATPAAAAPTATTATST